MKCFKIALLFAIVSISLQSCKDTPKAAIKTEPVIFKKEGELTIHQTEKDSVLVHLAIEIAESDYETQTGLMYRNSMDKEQGMLFIFPDIAMHSFYMKNTEFPLDIIFIGDDLRIASFQENAEPYNQKGLSSKVPVKYVLEVNAGMVEQWSLQVGDSISFIRL
ncbi:DUF192 domain-containing protein [Kriegella aquimaris]|uniref:DUF192 domain-containing protein n=1 Tax=Kriegella aquimaris TaxID=192904 RepID=A0A1G9RIP1_9FLAO|nr:DUF192 domain-containing protein [Kriegella aquimaris]SDM22920.1 hypothetical protein SAMN04488514_106154 [Kriegella aquimaris]